MLRALQDEVVLYDRETEVPTGERAQPTRKVRDKYVVRLADYDAAWEGPDGSLLLRVRPGHEDQNRRGQIHGFAREYAALLRAAIDPASMASGPPPRGE